MPALNGPLPVAPPATQRGRPPSDASSRVSAAERSSYATWACQLGLRDHAWGVAGGVIWAVGTLSNLISGDKIGMALSYAVGQAAPMVATLWGIFYYHEFRGAPLRSTLFVALMFALYVGAIGLIALSKSFSPPPPSPPPAALHRQ